MAPSSRGFGHSFLLWALVILFPIGFCYWQVAIVLLLLSITIILSPTRTYLMTKNVCIYTYPYLTLDYVPYVLVPLGG
jgi:hypothetical protein